MSSNGAAANILLDLVSGYDSDESEETNGTAFRAAFAALNEADVVVATQDDDGNVNLDMTPLLVASGWNHRWLLDQLSAATGKDRDTLIFELREAIARFDR